MSTFQDRQYQNDLDSDVCSAWEQEGIKNVLAVLPTGGGKTHIFTRRMSLHDGPSIAIAHRQELVTQISTALAKHGVKHRIIGPPSVIKSAVRFHMEEEGRCFYDANAWVGVAGVDTLIRPKRITEHSRFIKSVSFWVQDEAHHVLQRNKWGKAVSLFPNAVGLGVTATPDRADGLGLGSHADGVFDKMVIGPSLRDLINLSFLTDYRIFAPPSDYHRPSADNLGSDGDFTDQANVKAFRESKQIIGDIVKHYQRYALGKLGVTFVPDIETAHRVAAAFNAAGIAAKAVSSKTPIPERLAIMRAFRNGQLKQLVNVDLLGEGVDFPAIEVISFARATESLGLFIQQFGRALRLLDGKSIALIIDHVGNVLRHGLPDAPREWSLNRREKRSRGTSDGVIPVRSCSACSGVYERVYKVCPYCGHEEIPTLRSAPEFVDGDLLELDPAVLARMRGETARIDGPARFPNNASKEIQHSIHKKHLARQQAQEALRASIAWWAGAQRQKGRPDSESYRRFYHMFGIDTESAKQLGRRDALALANKVNRQLVKEI